MTLPNNLNGYIPITAISDQLNTKIEKLLGDEENGSRQNEDDGDGDGEEHIALKSMFRIGQYLRACVTSTHEGDINGQAGKAKKRIELSINPNLANGSMKASDLSVHNFVQASVISNEEHGLVMELGVDNKSLRGFMSSKELGNSSNHEAVKQGSVYLCIIKEISSDGKIVKLSADHTKARNIKNLKFLSTAPTVDALLPGTPLEFPVTAISASGISGKVMGVLDVTAEIFHSGLTIAHDLNKEMKIGSRARGRVIYTFPDSDPPKLGISLLNHVVTFSNRFSKGEMKRADPLEILPISSVIEEAKVLQVVPKVGLFLNVGVSDITGFAHISRLSDEKVDTLSKETREYKPGSMHRARVIGYNHMDGMFILSLEKRILDQPFLRIQDISVGQVVKGHIEKLIISQKGATNVVVKLADGIAGIVPETHLADVRLQYPERKFKEGAKVTARVLWTDSEKGLVRLTLKKTLVNSDVDLWQDYETILVGTQSPGTIVSLSKTGAVVQFYGKVRAWLPVSEMSEAFIKNPSDHFSIGQTVNVRVVSVSPSEEKMTVTCKSSSSSLLEHQNALKEIDIKSLVTGVVSDKGSDFITVKLENGVTGSIRIGQLSEGSEKKVFSALKNIRVGQDLRNVLVLNKTSQKPWLILSNKASIRESASKGQLPGTFDELVHGQIVTGFIRNITAERVFVEFAGGLVGLLFKSQLEESLKSLPDFGLRLDQSVTVVVSHIDTNQQRFWLSMTKAAPDGTLQSSNSALPGSSDIVKAGQTASIPDLTFGKSVQAIITSVKLTQLNVDLGEGIQGRIDMSEIFDKWEEIPDRKHPLRHFKKGQAVPVRVLGIHDARSWRFLPVSHRGSKNPVFELTARKGVNFGTESDLLSLEKISEGSEWIAFVNNISTGCLWVNLTPNVRGRVEFRELTDDLSQLENVEKSFPIGSALKVCVRNVDVATNRLDLTASATKRIDSVSWKNLTKGTILPARVTKVNENCIAVQLSDSIAAAIGLTELVDDFAKANPTIYKKNDIIRVRVIDVDENSKRLHLSCRPSNILNSELEQKDPQISSLSQLNVNDTVRGFVKNVSEKGLFVELGSSLTAFVMVKNLSDEYIKDWKSQFEIGRLVEGRITFVDSTTNHVQVSLKKSHLNNGYKPPLALEDLAVGQVVGGIVRKVYDYGVMIRVDNSNLAGLCHVSEMADQKVEDVKKIYTEGDAVKAVILKIDAEKMRLRFGLKASYFETSSDDSMADDDEEAQNTTSETAFSEVEAQEADAMTDDRSILSASDDGNEGIIDVADEMDLDEKQSNQVSALSKVGFDWTGGNIADEEWDENDSVFDEENPLKKKRRRKPEIKADRTGDLDKNGPQSVADFERLLLGKPHSSLLWIEYMAFQLRLNEVDKARDIATRALRTIDPREEEEKIDVRTALLNLENTFGDDSSLERVFEEACQYHDSREMHDRLVDIYIKSAKLEVCLPPLKEWNS